MSEPRYERPSMTLAQAIELAQYVSRDQSDPVRARELALGILDLLESRSECMLEPPEIVQFSQGFPGLRILEEGDAFTRGEARAYAAMILHQCDKADGG